MSADVSRSELSQSEIHQRSFAAPNAILMLQLLRRLQRLSKLPLPSCWHCFWASLSAPAVRPGQAGYKGAALIKLSNDGAPLRPAGP